MIYTDGIHLIGESIDEIHAFAKSIGLKKCWFHHRVDRLRPHYDLVNKKRLPLIDSHGEKFSDKAIRYGALKIGTRKLIKILRANFQLPTTDEEVEEFERRHKWFLEQPLTDKENKRLDRMWTDIQKKLFPDNNNETQTNK